MTLFDLILIAVSLSMDAFAVSICKGLSVRKVSLQHAMICGVWFGGFQFLMPALGYFLGDRFAALLTEQNAGIATEWCALRGFCWQIQSNHHQFARSRGINRGSSQADTFFL